MVLREQDEFRAMRNITENLIYIVQYRDSYWMHSIHLLSKYKYTVVLGFIQI